MRVKFNTRYILIDAKVMWAFVDSHQDIFNTIGKDPGSLDVASDGLLELASWVGGPSVPKAWAERTKHPELLLVQIYKDIKLVSYPNKTANGLRMDNGIRLIKMRRRK